MNTGFYRNTFTSQLYLTQLLNNTNVQANSLAAYSYPDAMPGLLGSPGLIPLPLDVIQKNTMWNTCGINRMSSIIGNSSYRERYHSLSPRSSSRESLSDSKTPNSSETGFLPTPKSQSSDNHGGSLQNTITNKGVKRQLDLTSSPKQGDTSKRRYQVDKQSCSTKTNDYEELRKSANASPNSTSGKRPLTLTPPSTPRVSLEQHKSDKLEGLSDLIWHHHIKHKQTDELYKKKVMLKEAVYGIIRTVLPCCKLYIVGSSLNGFGSKSSDMDMCLMLTDNEIDQKREATEILQYILKAVRKKNFICKADLIRAKVPIIKFQDRVSGVEVDLNINNVVGIRNTYLLKCYGKLDWRVQPLVMMVKRWARDHDINDASRQTLSSYSLVMMVIHFLQCGPSPPVLPCLQNMYPLKFWGDLNISSFLNDDIAPYHSENKNTLGQLLLGFFDYYTNKFNFLKEAISVRLGTKLPKYVVQNHKSFKNNPGEWKFVNIEEPFDLTNTARSVYSEPEFQRIKLVFQQTYQKLSQTKNLYSILKQE